MKKILARKAPKGRKILPIGGFHTMEDLELYKKAFEDAGFTKEQIKLIFMFCGGYPLGEKDGIETI